MLCLSAFQQEEHIHSNCQKINKGLFLNIWTKSKGECSATGSQLITLVWKGQRKHYTTRIREFAWMENTVDRTGPWSTWGNMVGRDPWAYIPSFPCTSNLWSPAGSNDTNPTWIQRVRSPLMLTMTISLQAIEQSGEGWRMHKMQ